MYSDIHTILWWRLDIADLVGRVDESCSLARGYKTCSLAMTLTPES